VVLSEEPLESIELIVNGRVAERFEPANGKSGAASVENHISTGFRTKVELLVGVALLRKTSGEPFSFRPYGPVAL
jgi:hypothetical protein